MDLRIYTDGSAAPTNPGPTGFGAMYVWEDGLHELGWASRAAGTNNTAELEGALEAIRGISRTPSCIAIVCDSQYVTRGCTEWLPSWKAKLFTKKGKPMKNQALWISMDAMLSSVESKGIPLEFDWVRGHSGDHYNEIVDDVARWAARAQLTGLHRGDASTDWYSELGIEG